MALALEKKFAALVGDVQAIQKELILSKMQHLKKTRRNQDTWYALSQKVSISWDSVSAVDEIVSQREKQW
jgi:sporulation protein YlmC with PRC-barrel domain